MPHIAENLGATELTGDCKRQVSMSRVMLRICLSQSDFRECAVDDSCDIIIIIIITKEKD